MPKPAPTFWWDFDKNLDIIVQSDYPGGECLERFPVVTKDATAQINMAEQLIVEFKAGRKTPPFSK